MRSYAKHVSNSTAFVFATKHVFTTLLCRFGTIDYNLASELSFEFVCGCHICVNIQVFCKFANEIKPN